MKSTSASIPDLERRNGIRLEDDIAGRLSELRRGGQVKDFYHQLMLRYFDQDVNPDFVVEVPRSNGLEIDIIEAKDWGRSKALTLHFNNVVDLVCQDERIDARNILNQVLRYDQGRLFDKTLRLFGRGMLIIVTTAPLYITENDQPRRETEILRIPVTTRSTTRSMNGEMQIGLVRSTIYVVSFAHFRD